MMSVCRHGVNKDNIGPIAKASFEETPEMFFRAAIHGELDNMRGVSANVMTGQEGYYGTASFGLLLDLEKLQGMEVKTTEQVVDEMVLTKQQCDHIQIHHNLGELVNTKIETDVTESEFLISL